MVTVLYPLSIVGVIVAYWYNPARALVTIDIATHYNELLGCFCITFFLFVGNYVMGNFKWIIPLLDRLKNKLNP